VDALRTALESGELIVAIVALMLIEALVLAVLWRRRSIGLPWRHFLGNLISGAALMLALRAALTLQPAEQIALWLLVALVAHLIDLRWRWRHAQSAET
jgi:hypothetical protein